MKLKNGKFEMENENKTKRLKKKIITRLIILPVILIIVLFAPAGSFYFWQAWLFIFVLTIPMIFTALYFLRNDPDLIERRIKTKETVKEQKLLIKIGYIIYLLIFIIPGLDYRFQWSSVPVYLVIAGDIIFLSGYILFTYVLKENSYASRVIEVDKNQVVISTGPYSFIRHPMYLAVLIMYFALPIALGSYCALLVSLTFPVFFTIRIINEEKFLSANLDGYNEYCIKTKYRLIPYLW